MPPTRPTLLRRRAVRAPAPRVLPALAAAACAIACAAGAAAAHAQVSSTGYIPGTTLPATRPRERGTPTVQPSAATVDEARAALGRGDANQALHLLERGLVNWPDDVQLRFLRGIALQRMGRSAQAEDAFIELTRQYPEMPEPYNNLAVVRAAQGNLDGARIALEDAVRALPRYALARENLGDVYAQMAARSYRAALELDPASRATADKLKLVTQINPPPAPVTPITRRR